MDELLDAQTLVGESQSAPLLKRLIGRRGRGFALDTLLHHVVSGDGPETVFFLHGFLGSGRNLGALIRRFSGAYPALRLVQVDLPGHGQSPPLPARPDLASLAAELLPLADHLGAAEFRIVGHSMGGRLGLALLGHAPNRVTRLDLLDITPGSTHHLPVGDVISPLLAAPAEAPDRRLMHQFFRDSGLTAAFTDWLLMNLERTPTGVRWRIDRQALADLHQRHANADLWPVVEAHPHKIHAIRGSESKYLGDDDVRRLERLGISVRTVEGAGHFVHADNPDGTFEAITAA